MWTFSCPSTRLSRHPSESHWDRTVWVYFGPSVLFHWHLGLSSVGASFDDVALQSVLKLVKCESPALFFFNVVLAIWVLCISIWTIGSVYHFLGEKGSWNSGWICRSIGEHRHLNSIQSFSSWKWDVFPFLYVFNFFPGCFEIFSVYN